MKKIAIFMVMTVILISTLGGCGKNSKNTPSSPTEPPQMTEIPRVETSVRQPTFCVSLEGYISILNPWLEYYGFETIDNLEYSEVGDIKAYSIRFDGFSIFVYTPLKSDEINQIVCRLDLDVVDEEAQSLFFDLSKATVYGLDFENAESILADLDYANITDGVKNTIDKNLAGYVYGVDANIVKLFIVAK